MKKVNPFYKSTAWLKCRLVILARDHHLCQPCLKRGRITEANTVHHIKPLEENPDLALEADNLESICPECHNKEHPEKGRRGRKLKVKLLSARVVTIKANEERW